MSSGSAIHSPLRRISRTLPRGYPAGVHLAAYLGTVGGLVTLAIGAMYVIVRLLGRRLEDVRADLGSRMDRLERQNEQIIGPVTDLGQRVTRLEH